MEKKEEILKRIPDHGVLTLYFYKDPEVSIEVLKTLYNAGIRIIEYTNRGEAALRNFKIMREVRDRELKGMFLGIDTIKNGEIAQTFIDAVTDFIICPGLVEEVTRMADKNNMLWIPGCMTLTEIIRALSLGAKMIKIFPGNILGPEFMIAIKTLFLGNSFIPDA